MTNKIRNFLNKFSSNPCDIDRLLVSAFIKVNGYVVHNNYLLLEHVVESDNEEDLNRFVELLCEENVTLDIEQLIHLFEFVISPAEKEVNGAVYTPSNIRDFIVTRVLENLNFHQYPQRKFADISCGCGGFFFSLIKAIRTISSVPVSNIIANCIYGVDIADYSIQRTKLLLSLIALTYGEDLFEYSFNLYVGNSLSFDWALVDSIRDNGGFDAIIGNPPYVSSSKIDSESKALLENWSVSKTGKTDLYIPFFQIALQNLRDNGVLGYITVNNFYRSLNGRAVRQYFADNKYLLRLIDFGSQQIFRGRSTYTCICLIQKAQGFIQYINCNSSEIRSLIDDDFINIEYDDLNHHEGWILQNRLISDCIEKIENTGVKLGECFDIKNGFATLRNDVFLFKPDFFDGLYYHLEKNGKQYLIEPRLCRKAIKPNTLKHESEIEDCIKLLIFPYQITKDRKIKLISERTLLSEYPNAYAYLLDNKLILSMRDKGARSYEDWFAYGRNQAITIDGYKLMFPYISDYPYFVFSNQRDLLFYNGYALVSENEEDLQVAKKVLTSDLFWFYIKHTSKPYGSNYYALAKNYVKNFGYFQFNPIQRQTLLDLNDSDLINRYLCDLYEIDFRSIQF